MKTRLGLNERGSIPFVLILGTAILATLAITSSSFLNGLKSEMNKSNDTFQRTVNKGIVSTFLASPAACRAQFGDRPISQPIEVPNLKPINNDGEPLESAFPLMDEIAQDFKIAANTSGINDTFIGVDLEFSVKIVSKNNPLGFDLKRESVKLLVDLDENGRIRSCHTNVFEDDSQNTCNFSKRGHITYDTLNKIAIVCDGTKWIGAAQSAGFFSYATNTNGGVGQCHTRNPHTNDCRCPDKYIPKLFFNFESHGCQSSYYNYGQGSDCGFKLVECINAELGGV